LNTSFADMERPFCIGAMSAAKAIKTPMDPIHGAYNDVGYGGIGYGGYGYVAQAYEVLIHSLKGTAIRHTSASSSQ
jgi:hypothetical protein